MSYRVPNSNPVDMTKRVRVLQGDQLDNIKNGPFNIHVAALLQAAWITESESPSIMTR